MYARTEHIFNIRYKILSSLRQIKPDLLFLVEEFPTMHFFWPNIVQYLFPIPL